MRMPELSGRNSSITIAALAERVADAMTGRKI